MQRRMAHWVGGGEWESFCHKALIVSNLLISQFTRMPRIKQISSYWYVLCSRSLSLANSYGDLSCCPPRCVIKASLTLSAITLKGDALPFTRSTQSDDKTFSTACGTAPCNQGTMLTEPTSHGFIDEPSIRRTVVQSVILTFSARGYFLAISSFTSIPGSGRSFPYK